MPVYWFGTVALWPTEPSKYFHWNMAMAVVCVWGSWIDPWLAKYRSSESHQISDVGNIASSQTESKDFSLSFFNIDRATHYYVHVSLSARDLLRWLAFNTTVLHVRLHEISTDLSCTICYPQRETSIRGIRVSVVFVPNYAVSCN